MQNTKLLQLLKDCYINNIPREKTSVGVEIELPLINAECKAIKISFIQGFAQHLKELGFSTTNSTADGYACEWINSDGDICSFETTWNTLELSMNNSPSLCIIAKRFYALLENIQAFCVENGHYLCGNGINRNCEGINTTPLNTPSLRAKAQFMGEFTEHKDSETFHAICASTQTHIDAVNEHQYIERFNFLRKAYVLDAFLFANSPTPSESFLKSRPSLQRCSTNTLCFRDELWKMCGAPNIKMEKTEFENTDELCEYLAQMKLFVLPYENGFKAIKPITLENYFKNNACSTEALKCFRSLEAVAVTKAGSLELRAICTQPLDYIFAPSAFYLGLVEVLPKASLLIDSFYYQYFTSCSPAQARDILMSLSEKPLRLKLYEESIKFVELALEGLRKRGFGEEQLLQPLYESLNSKAFIIPSEHEAPDFFQEVHNQMQGIRRYKL